MTTGEQKPGLRSMTGFAAESESAGDWQWTAEIRSVNGKGLDLRLRIPDWIEGLEQALRGLIGSGVKRGNVNVSLRVTRAEGAGGHALNPKQLAATFQALRSIEEQAQAAGLALAPTRASDIAQMRGVIEQQDASEEETQALKAALVAHLTRLAASHDAMRRNEGSALAEVLERQLTEIARLTDAAAEAAEKRRGQMVEQFQTALSRVMEGATGADPDRVAQELAMLAVKSDVTEEIDRLRAHVVAARDLVAGGGTVGRKLDFLMQEFNREANTLCSKAQNSDLTTIGLDLKSLIDQMREQVQNVE